MNKTIIVRSFGVRLLEKTHDAIITSIFALQNKLWNQLVELEEKHQREFETVLNKSDPAIPHLMRQAALLDQKSFEKGRIESSSSQQYETKSDDSLHLVDLRSRLKQARDEARKKASSDLEKLEIHRKAGVKALVKSSGLWWCQSENIVARYEVARIRAIKSGRTLRFHKFTGEDSLNIRFSKGGIAISKLMEDGTTMIRIKAPTQTELGSMLEHKRDGGQRFAVTLRIGGQQPGKDFPTVRLLATVQKGMELPAGIPLKTIALQRRVRQSRVEWALIFTFSMNKGEVSEELVHPRIGGVQMGWRSWPHPENPDQLSLRVATLSSAPDCAEHLILPPSWLRRMEFADAITAELDGEANLFWSIFATRAAAELLQRTTDDGWFSRLAQELAANTKPLHTQLLKFAKANERAGRPLGNQLSNELNDWCGSIVHRAQRAADIRHRAQENRNAIYRNFAAMVAKNCEVVGLKKIDLRILSQKSSVFGIANELAPLARRNRHWAALSILRKYIEHAVTKHGGKIILISSFGSSTRCHKCDHRNAPSEGAFYRCANCQMLFDKSVNSAHFLRQTAEKHYSV